MKWLRMAAAICVAAGVGLTQAPASGADVVDSAFIASLDGAGITYPSPGYAIWAARVTCAELDDGWSVATVVLTLARESYLSVDQAAYFTGAAIGAYCPWHASQVYGGAWA